MVEGVVIDRTSNLYGQTWGWDGTCHRKTAHHTHESARINDYTKSDLKISSKLDKSAVAFPIAPHLPLKSSQ